MKTIYYCHCSLWRKQTGTGANAGLWSKKAFCIKSKHKWVVLTNAHESFDPLPVIEKFLKYFE